MSLAQNENPFFHRAPIRDCRYFFGRTEETRKALQMLRNDQCISIVGPRRIGKTSLLFHLCDPEVRKEYDLGGEYLFVRIDCQGLGNLDKPRFYQWMWQEVKRALVNQGETCDWAESVADSSRFSEMMMMIQEMGYRSVLLFDEFDAIAQNSNLDHDLFSDLRSFVPTLAAYVTASHNSLHDMTYPSRGVLSSPFFNVFAEIHPRFLMPEETEVMISKLLEMAGRENLFTEKDLAFVFEVGGYHPFFLQLACYYLFEQKRAGHTELTAEDYEFTRRQYTEDAERFFRYTWDHLKEDERESMRLVSEGRIDQLDDERRQLLERECLLYNNAIFSSVFAEFLHKQKETTQELLESRKCQLSIICSERGKVGVRLVGSLSYEGHSDRTLEQRLEDRLDHLAIDAFSQKNWRLHVKSIGKELFEKLVLNRPEVAKAYHRAGGYVGQQATLSLALHAPRDFLRLPFEALHNEDEGYLCLRYPMYRVVSGCFFDKEPLSIALTSQPDPKRKRPQALVVASNTWRTPDERIPGVEEEMQKVSTLLQEYGFDVCSLSTDEATEQRVRHELTKEGYLLFHYAGHGSYDPNSPEKGCLYFWEGTKGKSTLKKLTASQLESLVQDTQLRFAYLSNCWGAHTAPSTTLLNNDFLGVVDGLVMGGVPAVLCFRWPVSDPGAQLLAHSFYSAWLDEEKRPDQALHKARRMVADQLGRDERAWFSPILIMRAWDFESL